MKSSLIGHDELVTPTVGICEDDESVRRVLTDALRKNGYLVLIARNGQDAVHTFGPPDSVDIIIMDIGLPDADGRDVCLALRAEGQQAPVLFLTALEGVHDRVAGFNAGGDDYVVKPFAISEILARLDALTRRIQPNTMIVSGLHLDPDRFTLRADGGEQRLTPTEFRFIAALAAKPGKVVRRRAVVAAAWPDGAQVSDNVIDTYVRRLRIKLEAVQSPVELQTVRGVGFVLQ